eukprot:gnl/TRDRNA2_/TRDRNA2_170467_c0_seq2.p2 gnl/TRDRNA2_/TRDRNA2_170467_c0~~gnl/TRDRNA2_/TRDRNA2_170467_c0_seq2.p2  ORF type:complete len:100 (+),score=15.95 gnl/TRDRNA2_/TRDRNA2_170467_c0_seq2:284-583(+)
MLKRLGLSSNLLKDLPEAMGSLTRLTSLDAENNRLTGVPPALLEKTCLEELKLRGNPVDRLQLQETPGFAAFLDRRKQKIDAKIAIGPGQIDLAVCGLD